MLTSFFAVFLAEMGDKTQLLVFTLGARFRKPWQVMAGVLAATLLNHGISAWVGSLLGAALSPKLLEGLLTLSFLGFGAWALRPDRDEAMPSESRFGAFLTTLGLFFLAEVGDKTQLATLALAAHYHDWLRVLAATTLAMLAADGLAVFLGGRIAHLIPARALRMASAGVFFGLGLLALVAWMRA
jgi:putative Ca2+/H+ antiporter (TMEM165/GDT1 family)